MNTQAMRKTGTWILLLGLGSLPAFASDSGERDCDSIKKGDPEMKNCFVTMK